MKKTIFLSMLGALVLSCTSKKQNTFTLTGQIKDLKKGMLYLQRATDSAIVTIDSVRIHGNANFSFSMPLQSPEVLYLQLDKEDNNPLNDQFLFFAEPTQLTFTSTRDYFDSNGVITGSKAHDKLVEHNKISSKFYDKNILYIAQNLAAKKNKDIKAADSIGKLATKNKIRKDLYTLNFVLQNPDSYASPYIALTELPDAKLKYLDTIYKTLTPKVQTSKYGALLKQYIEDIKTSK